MRFLGSNHSSGAIGQSQIFLLIPSTRKIITQTAPGLSHVVSVFPALTFATFTFPLISFDLYLAAIGLDKVVGFSEGLGPFPIGVNRSHDVFSDQVQTRKPGASAYGGPRPPPATTHGRGYEIEADLPR